MAVLYNTVLLLHVQKADMLDRYEEIIVRQIRTLRIFRSKSLLEGTDSQEEERSLQYCLLAIVP